MTEFTGEVHPYAAIFPMLPDEDLKALADDIAANGQLHPILLTPAGVLVDGRNRLAACDLAGVEPRFEVTESDPVALVMSANLQRRDLPARRGGPGRLGDAVTRRKCWCPECGAQFNGSDSSGGHCRGGTYGGCCKSFRSLGGFDKHWTGTFEPNTRRCLTGDELLAKGWTVDDNNTWRMPAPKTNPWKKEASA